MKIGRGNSGGRNQVDNRIKKIYSTLIVTKSTDNENNNIKFHTSQIRKNKSVNA